MENQKKLEILVVEDNSEYLKVAKKVYDADKNIRAAYASTFEEAMNYLKAHNVNGVITDLFFPSEINWVNKFLLEIRKGVLKKMSEKGELPEDVLSSSDENLGNYDEYLIVGSDLYTKRNITVKDFRDLPENPSGLGIAEYSLQHKMPFLIISQGQTHGGDLGTVRYALRYSESFRVLLNYESGDYYDPLERMAGDVLGRLDKSEVKTWVTAARTIEEKSTK